MAMFLNYSMWINIFDFVRTLHESTFVLIEGELDYRMSNKKKYEQIGMQCLIRIKEKTLGYHVSLI